MIECLVLEFLWMEERFQVCAQKTHAIELIGFRVEFHPHEMDVIRHQAIDGTEKPFARWRMEHEFAESLVEGFRQQARRAFFECEVPVNERPALAALSLQARQMALKGAGVSRS